ncbi:MAG: hypothetical protein ACKOWL_04485 [Sphingobacteriaceae bacterium]
MNKFSTHQIKHPLTSTRSELTDELLLSLEDQAFISSLRPKLDQLLREPSEDVMYTILTFAEAL